MTDDDLSRALEKLRSPRETERLDAARSIQAFPTPSQDVDRAVREALARETVPWVRGALTEILVEGNPMLDEGVVIPAPSWDDRLDGLQPDMAQEVLNLSTRRILHEVSAVVGRARLAAGEELGEAYAPSETGRQLRFLADMCAGLRTLAAATQAPRPNEFDLSAELQELAGTVSADRLWPMQANGPSPFVVTADWTLLQLAVRNVLINAVEATQSVGPADPARAVIVTWGQSAYGIHITVIDRGPGPPRLLSAVKRAGVSTKIGHPGYGLATASEAMRSLGGRVEIQRNERGGATVVLSWGDADE